MHPHGTHYDIGLGDLFVAGEGVGVGPDMERKIRSSDCKVGGVEEGKGIDEDAGDRHGNEERSENMSGCVLPIAG